jgi:hypothetical protein
MSKRIFLCVLFLGVIYSLDAQVLVGPVIGPQLSWVSFDDGDNNQFYRVKPSLGYQIGGAISFRVRSRFFLQASILYSRKGKEIEGKLDKQLSNKVMYSSIDMPIVYTAEFKGKIGRNKAFKWFIGAGPNISYWLGGSGTIQSSDAIDNRIGPLDYDIVFGKKFSEVAINEMNVENPNRIQLGLNLVTGTVFEPVGLNKIMLTARFEIGHSFFSDNSVGSFPAIVDYVDVLRARNFSLIFSAAYFIDLKTDQRKRGKSVNMPKSR